MLSSFFLRILSLLIGILFAFSSQATNYYLSTSGKDTNAGTDPSLPWQTLSKLNSFKNLKPGDNVFFKRGDTFYGSLTVNNSGTAGNPITFGAYGTGENPVITGFTNVTQWTNLGGNIWESTNAVSTLPSCNMVVINGVNTPMGRYPNSGYITFQSHSGKTSITSSNLTGTPNWAGAEVVIRSTQWTLERKIIKSQSVGQLTYDATEYEPTNGFGFFIQNDARTLDSLNEWYYNPSTKKIRVYSLSAPVNFQMATTNDLVTVHGSFLNFGNLTFLGANNCAFINNWSGIKNISVQKCIISFVGVDAINLAGTDNFTVQYNTVSNSNNNTINLYWENQRSTINNNEITNSGALVGMGQSTLGAYCAINTLFSSKANIFENKIINTGYIGIFAIGDSFVIKNNYVHGFCSILQDGGGIYTHAQQGVNYGRKITDNIVINGIGASAGTNDASFFWVHGIYLDDLTSNIEVSGNTTAHCSGGGLFIHNGYNLNIYDNTFYNNNFQFVTQTDAGNPLLAGNTFKNNVFFSKNTAQLCGYFASPVNDFLNWGTVDSNYYARPIDDNFIFNTRVNWGNNNYRTLDGWKTYTGLDLNSKKSPKIIRDINELRFEYNADITSKTIALDGNYMDVKGQTFNGEIVLAPFSSVVLLKNGPVKQPPKANAGMDQTIFLPVNFIRLSGSATSDNETIISYFWTKISGPASGSIATANSLEAQVNGLIEGTYQFELKVTDNEGAEGRDTMQVIVKRAPNIAPVASAGGNQSITLPVNNVSLSGSGTDADGTIVAYLWSKISGPSSFQVKNERLALTEVSGLVEGVYQFELKVTDNEGAEGRDTMQVIVKRAPNIAPVSMAGGHQTITLPVNKISLSGSGTDADGTIVAYLWSKISGPSSFQIKNERLPVTEVSGLVEGIYQFELKVTDNEGAEGSDTMQLTVYPAHIPPVVNAGRDITVLLPLDSVKLMGTAVATGSTIISWQWRQVSGPSAAFLQSESSAETWVKHLAAGKYEFELTVKDSNGETGKDTVSIVAALGRVAAEEGNKIKVYPNPVTEGATLEINTKNTGSKVSVFIADVSGRIVYRKQISTDRYQTIEKINMSRFSKGNYKLNVVFDEGEKQILSVIKL